MSSYTKIVWISLFWSILKQHKKAIEYMKNHRDELSNFRELSSVTMSIGMEYLKLKEKKIASNYFVEALEIVEHKYLEFHPDFPKIFKVIYENQARVVQEKWHENFSQRVKEDKRFRKCLIVRKA